MIKEFKNITEKDLNYMKTHQVTVTEKLDLIYFKVFVTEDKIDVFTARNKPITEIDQIVNSVYKDIVEFCKGLDHQKIFDTFGVCEIGFFYKPVEKTLTIRYPKLSFNFIVSNLFTKKKDMKRIEVIKDVIKDVDVLMPICYKENISDIPDDLNNDIDNAIYFTDGRTWSGNSIYETEGLILTCGRLNYQIIINHVEPKIEKTTKKIYRDTILENFCSFVMNNEDCLHILDQNDTPYNYTPYIEKICSLFLIYIDGTNIFTKLKFEPEDLLPPNAGYIGDIDYDKLPTTVSLICRGNEIYKNILRILLVTFNRSVFDNKFKNFSNDTRAKLTQILAKINSVD